MNWNPGLAGMMTLLVTLADVPVASAAEWHVTTAAELQSVSARARPGDVLVMKSGTWLDVDLVFQGKGTAEAPVVLRAESPGTVVISGNSRLRLGGEHLQVEGLWFKDALPTGGDVVAFRVDSKTLASHCRMTQCAITEGKGAGDGKDRKWVSLYGEHHTVDHCHFAGKTGKGTLMVVWLDGREAAHTIEANSFGERLRLGKNGGEILRVGDSDSSMQNARCRVLGNLFEHCSGEVEVISNKSCENVYQGNLFRECQGTLTLRHGNRCRVEGNVFLGNGVSHTGGIRIIGEEHQVVGNYLERLEGTEARAAICLMNGIVSSPANGYFQVKKAVVKGNYINQCRQSINIGYADKDVKAPLEPVECVMEGNVIHATTPVVTLTGSGAGITWSGGNAAGTQAGMPASVPAGDASIAAYLKAIGRKPMDESKVGAAWLKRE
jgi:poly(beta-D-mannuronate) lyase